MKTVNLIQGSDEWKEHRAAHFNASDSPAMMGVSKYKTRSQLVKEYATGIIPEVDANTQRIFDNGHRFEALARPIAEQIIGDDLSPTVGVNGNLSASFDGITFDESIIFEHKTLNDDLRACTSADDLHEQYHMQMEHQLAVSGADKCLFMASKFDDNDNLVEEVHFWYEPKPNLRKAIIAGWDQFALDVAAYKPEEVVPEVIAAPIKDLPALSIQVNGSISLISNLQKFGARLNEFVEGIDKEPSDDQGFADAEAAIKVLKNAQDALEAAEANALAQTSDIDEMRKTVKLYADTARTTRLMLEKMVKARKESIRIEIVQDAKAEFAAHYRALELEIKPLPLMVSMPDFAGAIKGKKTIASLRKATRTALRNGKMEADALAADIRNKLDWYEVTFEREYDFLFKDLQEIITKNSQEAFESIVFRRTDEYKSAEAAKLEAQRVAMREEADAKAKAEADALIAAERAKMEADLNAKAEAERQRVAAENKAQMEAQAKSKAEQDRDAEAAAIEERRKAAQIADSANRQGHVVPIKSVRPTDAAIVEVLALHYRVHESKVLEWLIDMDMNELTEQLLKEFA